MSTETACYTVYRLYDSERNLLYIGATKRLEQRMREHADNKAWWPDVAETETETFANRKQAAERELAQITTLMPRYNRRHNWEYRAHTPRPSYKRAHDTHIGERLRHIRERRYLTQRELAEKAGVSADTIVKLENNRWEPRLRTIRRLATALDVHPDELSGFGSED